MLRNKKNQHRDRCESSMNDCQTDKNDFGFIATVPGF